MRELIRIVVICAFVLLKVHFAASLQQTLVKLPLAELQAGHKRLYVVRHGETDWNAQGRIQGGTDIPLNSYGRWQAEQLGMALAETPFDVIASSDLDRASDTADAIWGHHRSSSKRIVTNKLAEMRFGMWEGQVTRQHAAFDQIAAMIQKDESLAWPNGGESTKDVKKRIRQALGQIMQSGDHVCCVAHGRFNRILLEFLTKSTRSTKLPKQVNAGISVVDYDPEEKEWMLQLCNYQDHLEQ